VEEMAKLEWSKLINPFLSFFDKEFRGWAKKGADSISKDSPLRSEGVERGFDILRGFIEKNVQFDSPTSQALKEKIVDIGDYFASSFFGREKADKKSAMAAQDWMRRFLAHAEKRLSEAKSVSSLEAQIKRLEKEFELRKRIIEIVGAAAKAAESQEPETAPVEPINWGEKFESIKKRWEEKLKPQLIEIDNKAASEIRNFRKSVGWLRPRKIRRGR